jgi:putative membrane protein
MPRTLATTALLSALLATPALAQSMSTPGSAPPAPAMAQKSGEIGAADRTFAHDAAVGGMAEVALGKLAATKGTTEDVKNFGQRMVTDHTKADDQLASIARQEGITLPTALDRQHQAAYDRLDKESGATFDRMYIDGAVTDHQKTIALFQREAKSGDNAPLKQFAATTLPVFQHHLQMAEAIQSRMKERAPQASAQPQESSGSSMAPRRRAHAGDTSANELNQQELNQIQQGH